MTAGSPRNSRKYFFTAGTLADAGEPRFNNKTESIQTTT